MASISDFTLGSTVTFSVYPTAIIGNNYKRVRVMAIIDADTARQYIDPISLHANVYPTLPEETPENAYEIYYLKIRFSNGQFGVLGLPWIREDTIEIQDMSTIKLTIEDVAASDIDKVLLALSSNGFKSVDVEVL